MKIILISSVCSDVKYAELIKNRKHGSIDSSQNFYSSLVKGLSKIDDVVVECITKVPIESNNYNRNFREYQFEKYANVNYHYMPYVNIPVFRNNVFSYYVKKTVKKIIKNSQKGEKIFVISDLLYGVDAAINYCRKKGIKSMGCILDIPEVLADMYSTKGIRKIIDNYYYAKSNEQISIFDSYLVLTEQMVDKCDIQGKPHIVVDCIINEIEFSNQKKHNKRPIVLYAGKFVEQFGILELAKSATMLKDVCDIWLYGGNSDCQEELEKIAKENSNLLIHDVVDVNTIRKLERSVDLLINPRPPLSFTSYSFPSKTAEYMMSATPVLMFKLPGIDDIYDKYLFYIDDYSSEGIANSIARVLNMDKEELNKKASEARKYIIENKNEEAQSRRIYKFICSL